MAFIKTKLRCSECGTVRDGKLNTDDKDIVCPVCARRIQNLTPDEHNEMLAVQKKQGLFCIISIVLFVLCAGLLLFWTGETATWASGAKSREANAALFWAGMVSGLAAMVVGIMGSWRRFVIEF
jgi:DNA-directed RNA polymerase subunit RPC12/RpoP